MFAVGFATVGAGALGTTTVVGVVDVVGVAIDLGAVVVVVGAGVGAGEACDVGFDDVFVTLVIGRMMCFVRADVFIDAGFFDRVAFALCFATVVVVAGRVVVVVGATVVEVVEMVVPRLREVEGSMTVAMAGSAVALRTTPTTSDPIAPINTDRRGRRPGRLECLVGSPAMLCPCVIFVI